MKIGRRPRPDQRRQRPKLNLHTTHGEGRLDLRCAATLEMRLRGWLCYVMEPALSLSGLLSWQQRCSDNKDPSGYCFARLSFFSLLDSKPSNSWQARRHRHRQINRQTDSHAAINTTKGQKQRKKKKAAQNRQARPRDSRSRQSQCMDCSSNALNEKSHRRGSAPFFALSASLSVLFLPFLLPLLLFPSSLLSFTLHFLQPLHHNNNYIQQQLAFALLTFFLLLPCSFLWTYSPPFLHPVFSTCTLELANMASLSA